MILTVADLHEQVILPACAIDVVAGSVSKAPRSDCMKNDWGLVCGVQLAEMRKVGSLRLTLRLKLKGLRFEALRNAA